ncbi:MAG: hypothetical protein AB1651_16880 [Pseudomonadota bacterium]
MNQASPKADGAPRFLRPITCPRCRAVAVSVLCACGEFKLPRSVAPFADELAADERRAT